MKGIVSEVKTSPSGKSYIAQIGEQGYFAKLDSKIDAAVGKAIDFSINPNVYKGKTVNWIADWDFDRNPPQQAPVMGSAVPASGTHITKDLMHHTPPIMPADRFYMPFVSNVVAHCIAAGLIKEPTQIGSWARAAYRVAVVDLDRAFEEKKGKFDDSMDPIPF